MRLIAERGKWEVRHLTTFVPFLRPYRWQIAAALSALVVSTGAVLLLGVGIRWLADASLANSDATRFGYGLLYAIPIVAVVATASAARSYYIHWIGERVAADLRCALYNHLLGLDASFFASWLTGELVSSISADAILVRTVFGSTTSVALRNVFMIVGGLAMMIATSVQLTGLLLVMVLLLGLPTAVLSRRVRGLSKLNQDELGRMTAYAQDTLAAVQTVQAYGHEVLARRRFAELVEYSFRAAVNRIQVRSSMIAIIILSAFSILAVVLWLGVSDASAGRITAGKLSAFVFYGALVAGSTGTLTEYLTDLMRVAGVATRFRKFLLTKPKITAPPQPQVLPIPPRGAVHFENVTFAYPSRSEEFALSNFALHVEPGEKVALVGPSGAGKTTVFQLLLRFYDPQLGRVMFDGQDIRLVDPSELRARIGVVSQEPVIFSADAWENIRFGRPTASNEEVRIAAQSAGALDFLESLPRGLSTYLGERGAQLSGGQRQRVAIARAILRNPVLLLLDEATNSLDAENEQRIREALAVLMAGRTTLVIAHRLTTVRQCDRIIVMDRSRIIDEGAHDDLFDSCPLYRRLVSIEFADAVAPEKRVRIGA